MGWLWWFATIIAGWIKCLVWDTMISCAGKPVPGCKKDLWKQGVAIVYPYTTENFRGSRFLGERELVRNVSISYGRGE